MQNMKSARNLLKTPGQIVSGGAPTIKNRRPRFVDFGAAWRDQRRTLVERSSGQFIFVARQVQDSSSKK